MGTIELAKETLAKSWLKRDTTNFNSASVAVTENNFHASGLFESRTHLLDITSEHAALALAINRKDPYVTKIVTVVDGEFNPNPLVIKILADHYRRTGTDLKYEVYDKEGNKIYSQESVKNAIYNPQKEIIETLKTWNYCDNKISLDNSKPIKQQLKKAALQGMQTHFSSNTKTKYGAAVLAGDKIYFGGVHSSYDKRLNLHAEMVAAISAINNLNRQISHVALMSNKFVQEVPHMCGCCRQFFSEIQEKTKTPIKVLTFSFDGQKEFETKLDEYLPAQWHSGKKMEDR